MVTMEGKVALVTGGGSGIGRAIALAFARQGVRVVVADVDASSGEETTHAVTETGVEALFVQTDVANGGEVENMITRAVTVFGRLDCACNNAGIAGVRARTAECTEENWDRTLVVNLKSVWLCMK